MTDYTELKRLVEAGSLPPIVSTLIAENERLRADLDGEMSRARDFNLEHEELKHERDQLKAGFKTSTAASASASVTTTMISTGSVTRCRWKSISPPSSATSARRTVHFAARWRLCSVVPASSRPRTRSCARMPSGIGGSETAEIQISPTSTVEAISTRRLWTRKSTLPWAREGSHEVLLVRSNHQLLAMARHVGRGLGSSSDGVLALVGPSMARHCDIWGRHRGCIWRPATTQKNT